MGRDHPCFHFFPLFMTCTLELRASENSLVGPTSHGVCGDDVKLQMTSLILTSQPT